MTAPNWYFVFLNKLRSYNARFRHEINNLPFSNSQSSGPKNVWHMLTAKGFLKSKYFFKPGISKIYIALKANKIKIQHWYHNF